MMNKSWLHCGLSVFLGFLCLLPGVAIAESITTVTWDNLIPKTVVLLPNAELTEREQAPAWGSRRATGKSGAKADQTELTPELMQELLPLVKTFDNRKVSLSGYMVPLDFEAARVRNFLLVPFVGACIHVPPPPPNQIVFVQGTRDFAVTDLWTPITVTGVFNRGIFTSDLAEAGYTIAAETVQEYKHPNPRSIDPSLHKRFWE